MTRVACDITISMSLDGCVTATDITATNQK
jgi:hypothetical protein